MNDPRPHPPQPAPPIERNVPYVVAVAVLVLDDGRVLAMRRSPRKDAGPGLWEALSGRVQEDEEPLDAARREVLEECGLDVTVDPRPITAYAARRNDDPMIVIVYRAERTSGDVVLSDEHDAYDWLTANEFAERSPLAPLVRAARHALAEPPTRRTPGATAQ